MNQPYLSSQTQIYACQIGLDKFGNVQPKNQTPQHSNSVEWDKAHLNWYGKKELSAQQPEQIAITRKQ
jgi:hypothetical protein